MKTIKISQEAHKELKIFCANQPHFGKVGECADKAIIYFLKQMGHKFSKIKIVDAKTGKNFGK